MAKPLEPLRILGDIAPVSQTHSGLEMQTKVSRRNAFANHRHAAYHVRGMPGKPEQRFFLAFAQGWRNNRRPELTRLLIATDPHSPPRFRVLGPLSNMPEFVKAFDCDGENSMARPEAVRVNIW